MKLPKNPSLHHDDAITTPLQPYSKMNSLEVGESLSQDTSTVLLHPSKLKELDLFEGDTVMVLGRKKRFTCVQIREDSSVAVEGILMPRGARANIRYTCHSGCLFR